MSTSELLLKVERGYGKPPYFYNHYVPPPSYIYKEANNSMDRRTSSIKTYSTTCFLLTCSHVNKKTSFKVRVEGEPLWSKYSALSVGILTSVGCFHEIATNLNTFDTTCKKIFLFIYIRMSILLCT